MPVTVLEHFQRCSLQCARTCCQDVSFVVSPCPELDCTFVFPAEVVDAKTSLESHQLQCTFESTEVSAVPAEVVDAKTCVEGSLVAAHIFTSHAGPMDQLTVSGIMMLGSSRALWRHTYFYFIATSKVLHRDHTLELIADFHVDLSVGIWAACPAGLATATQQPPTLHL